MGLVNSSESGLEVLHICSDYAKQRLYGEMISHLAARGIEQFVYVPVRSTAEINCNRVTDLDAVQYKYSHILRKYHRIFFRLKVNAILRDLQQYLHIRRYSLVHAHFLYSDGAVARQIQKCTGVPYVVTVRNTDINVFMRLRPDLRWICWDIVRNASSVVFVTPSYLRLMCRRAPEDVRLTLEKYSEIVPNGLESFWLNNIGPIDRSVECPLRLLYVGDFSQNKNIIGAMKATRIVNEKIPATLTLVGGSGDGEAQVDKLLESGEWPFINRIGRVECRESMRDIYRSHDIFLMPSFFETFGLAYIEALSQGIPVVHSRGQGIDGYFSTGTVAEAVDPTKPTSIAEGVLAILSRLPGVRAQCIRAVGRFSWSEITQTYERIYLEATDCGAS